MSKQNTEYDEAVPVAVFALQRAVGSALDLHLSPKCNFTPATGDSFN